MRACHPFPRGKLPLFASDRSGQIALMFALAMLPISLGVGAAVDYSRAGSVKAQLQSALDAAVLAGAADQTSAQVSTATDTFKANYKSPYGTSYGNLSFS